MRHRRGLAPGDHQRVAGLELLVPPYAKGAHAERAQRLQVLAHVALEGQHPDRGARGVHLGTGHREAHRVTLGRTPEVPVWCLPRGGTNTGTVG